MHQHDRKTAETHRDGAAARVVAAHREEAATNELPVPRRKRYFTPLDLDAVAPADAEACAPRRALDI